MKYKKKVFYLIFCAFSSSLAFSFQLPWKKNKSQQETPSVENTVHKLIIVGGGPAGLTAAIYAARANLQPLVLEGSSNPGGQLMGATHIQNWPGEKKILGTQLITNFKEHAQHFGTSFLSENIVSVDFSQKPFTLLTEKNKELKAHCVIIATGTRPNQLYCPGEADYWGKGVAICTHCDGPLYRDKKVMVVGGGNTAMYYVLALKKFTKNIILVQNQDKLNASPSLQKKVLDDPDITVMYNSKVTEIKGDSECVTGVTIANEQTGEKKDMSVDGVFVAIGKVPNTEPFKNQLEVNEAGYLAIKNYTHTSIPGVFAAGDLHDYHYKQAVIMAGAGCMAVIDAQQYLEQLFEE